MLVQRGVGGGVVSETRFGEVNVQKRQYEVNGFYLD